MKLLLLDIKSEVDKAPSSDNALTLEKIIPYEENYDSIIRYGQEEDFKLNFDSKTGKSKKSKSRALLERLSLHKNEVIKFMNDFDIPFDNKRNVISA